MIIKNKQKIKMKIYQLKKIGNLPNKTKEKLIRKILIKTSFTSKHKETKILVIEKMAIK